MKCSCFTHVNILSRNSIDYNVEDNDNLVRSLILWYLTIHISGPFSLRLLPISKPLLRNTLYNVSSVFLPGDNRVNVWSGLTGMHGTFVLEHNRIADLLFPIVKEKYPNYSLMQIDEVTFEEARRIVGAIHQVNWFIPFRYLYSVFNSIKVICLQYSQKTVLYVITFYGGLMAQNQNSFCMPTLNTDW